MNIREGHLTKALCCSLREVDSGGIGSLKVCMERDYEIRMGTSLSVAFFSDGLDKREIKKYGYKNSGAFKQLYF